MALVQMFPLRLVFITMREGLVLISVLTFVNFFIVTSLYLILRNGIFTFANC